MKAYELIDSPEKWTKGALARSKTGRPVVPRSKRAVCYCAIGAMRRAYGETPALSEAIARFYRPHAALFSLGAWNDRHDWQTVYRTLMDLDI